MPERHAGHELKALNSGETATDSEGVIRMDCLIVNSGHRIETRTAGICEQLSWLDEALDGAKRFVEEMNTQQSGE